MKDLKARVEKFEKKGDASENPEIKEIVEKQRLLIELVEANSERIRKVDSEIKDILSKRQDIPPSKEKDSEERDSDEIKQVVESNPVIKKCRYFNKGYCKYEEKCKFRHPLEICQIHVKSLKCTIKGCKNRHPKTCKWFNREVGCKRQNCDFLHVTHAGDDQKENTHKVKGYECGGCKSIFPQANYVVKHEIKNTEVLFCLNCNDWIRDKEQVLNKDWTLFDINGDLRRDI